MDPEQFNIVHNEVNSHSRTIKEAMFIHVQDPTLNMNLRKYQLPHIWDHLLSCITNLTVQAFQPSNYNHPTLSTNPPTGSPHTIPPTVHIGGGHIHLW